MVDSILTEAQARDLYTRGDAAHDFDHVLRVMRMAERLARAEGANETVVRLAALLHDVPVENLAPNQSGRAAHHLAAAEFAREFLRTRGLDENALDNVAHCIEAHRYRDTTIAPQTLEARCVYDADKLDSLGAIGVARVFAFAGAHGHRLWTQPVAYIDEHEKPAGAEYTPVHEFVYKLRKLHDALHTETARQIGLERHQRMVAFFNELDAEAETERQREQL